ncbi:MAG TPA: hypothetical protein VMR50_01285 [Myxococcota bacterium]|nr:hypothetical protein [Myxococcota bacterium]
MTRRLAAPALLLVCAGCAGAALPPSGAPPATLPPARGYVAATPRGVELEYDAARQLYQVRSQPGTFWLDGRFFRSTPSGWQTSPQLEGPWQAAAAGDLPQGLR